MCIRFTPDKNQRLGACISDVLKCGGSGLRKFHCEPPITKITPKVLAKQSLDIRLVVRHENEQTHSSLQLQ
jgi:hypothetical protein